MIDQWILRDLLQHGKDAAVEERTSRWIEFEGERIACVLVELVRRSSFPEGDYDFHAVGFVYLTPHGRRIVETPWSPYVAS